MKVKLELGAKVEIAEIEIREKKEIDMKIWSNGDRDRYCYTYGTDL